MRFILTLCLIVCLLYACYVGYFYLMQRTILFPRHLIAAQPVQLSSIPGLEQVWLETSVGKVEMWFLPPLVAEQDATASVMIITHGNGELIDGWADAVLPLRRMGMGVLLVEYPGYGRSQGTPSQATIAETLAQAYDWVVAKDGVDPERICLFGRSVGGGAISALAAQRPSAGLILFSTFSSVRTMAEKMLLPGMFVRDPFDNLAVVRAYQEPLLIIHGTRDEVIPYAHGEQLAAANPNAEFISYACGHNDCVHNWASFWADVKPFLMQAGILPQSAPTP